MDIDFSKVLTWLVANPDVSIAVALFALYWARAAMPRIPPTHPFWFKVWTYETRLLALPWSQWFGKPHLPGKIVPALIQWTSEQPTRKDTPTVPPKGVV